MAPRLKHLVKFAEHSLRWFASPAPGGSIVWEHKASEGGAGSGTSGEKLRAAFAMASYSDRVDFALLLSMSFLSNSFFFFFLSCLFFPTLQMKVARFYVRSTPPFRPFVLPSFVLSAADKLDKF